MNEFSNNNIDEAKRRVQEMHSRAREFIDEKPQEPKVETDNSNISSMISSLFSSNDSSLILALVLILSHEKADNMLILALLYILL